VGVGYKTVSGEKTGELAVAVFVDRKTPGSQLDARCRIPDRLRAVSPIDGREVDVATDVVEAARPVPASHVDPAALRVKIRPAPGGVTIACPSGSGTLGGWAVDTIGSGFVFLSNRHVLGTAIGATVMQPFFPLPGDPTDYTLGSVRRVSSIWDAAIGAPFQQSDAATEIFGNGPAIYELASPAVGMEVEKTGMSTGHSEGIITFVNVSTVSPCVRSSNAFIMAPSIAGERLVDQGDSGSLIMERIIREGVFWKRCVGLLFCMRDDRSAAFGHPITDIFADLGLITVCSSLAMSFDSIFSAAAAEGVQTTAGFARDVEARLSAGKLGLEVVDAVSAHRADIVRLLQDGDGVRGLEAALFPLLKGATTTDDLLDRVVTGEDVERFDRVFSVAERVAPGLLPELSRARQILSATRERTLRSVFLDG
ncbi:MAG TPA: hypothetical protein VF771_21585, partial [Longimicrobiaceae bacterium]